MPDEFERHSRINGWEWGQNTPRSQARRAAAQVGETPGRKPKNTRTPKKQCTGSADGLHHGEPRLQRRYQKKAEPMPDLTCRWMARFYVLSDLNGLVYWNCYHNEYCTECGGKMADSMDERCPLFPGDPEQKKSAEKRTLELAEEQKKRRAVRIARNSPQGPQGYRKPKGA